MVYLKTTSVSRSLSGVALQPAMKNAPFPETLALVIYVGTVLTLEAWAAQPGLGGGGAGGRPGREAGALALPAPAFRAPPSTSTSRTFYSRSPRKLSALSR